MDTLKLQLHALNVLIIVRYAQPLLLMVAQHAKLDIITQLLDANNAQLVAVNVALLLYALNHIMDII
jgi:hypothetical protein